MDKIEEEQERLKIKTKRTDSIEDYKRRISLTEVVKKYVDVVRDYGTYWQGHCPFHDDRVPSFTVYENTGSYYCFGCGRWGDVITFIREKEGMDFIDATKKLEELTGVKYPDIFQPQNQSSSLLTPA